MSKIMGGMLGGMVAGAAVGAAVGLAVSGRKNKACRFKKKVCRAIRSVGGVMDAVGFLVK